jgi:hypothetical protein
MVDHALGADPVTGSRDALGQTLRLSLCNVRTPLGSIAPVDV